MTARTLPNLGLKAFFDLGEDGWDDEMNQNILSLSVLTQARVLDLVSATPGSPSDGNVYLFDETHPTQPNRVAVRDNGAWVYLTPATGWLVYDLTAAAYRTFNGLLWEELATGSDGVSGPGIVTVTDATYPVVGSEGYIVFDRGTAQVITLPVTVPVGFQFSGHRQGAGSVTFAAGSGATILSADNLLACRTRYSAFTATKISTTQWAITGDLA